MTPSNTCVLLGILMITSHGLTLAKPLAVGEWLKKFPRNVPIGVVLMLIGTAWFEWNLWQENLSDIAPWKNLMLIGFALVGCGSCVYVRDYLSVRGLSVVMLMAAWWLIELVRFHESPWRRALVAWGYVWAVLGIWWSMSPWRLRDAIQWVTSETGRLRLGALAGILWGAVLIALGLTALR